MCIRISSECWKMLTCKIFSECISPQTVQVLIMLFHRTSFSPSYASSKATGNIHISLFYPTEAKRGLRSMIYNGQRLQVVLVLWPGLKTKQLKELKREKLQSGNAPPLVVFINDFFDSQFSWKSVANRMQYTPDQTGFKE